MKKTTKRKMPEPLTAVLRQAGFGSPFDAFCYI